MVKKGKRGREGETETEKDRGESRQKTYRHAYIHAREQFMFLSSIFKTVFVVCFVPFSDIYLYFKVYGYSKS